MRKYILPPLLLRYMLLLKVTLIVSRGAAQQELMLYLSPETWHANTVNPALFLPEKNIFIGGPSLGLDAAHSGDIAYRDLLRREGKRSILDLSGAISKLQPENTLRIDQRNERALIGFRLGGWYLSGNWSQRTATTLTYTRALAELLWYGNGPFVGQLLDIGPSLSTIRWDELGVGLARSVGNRLCIGVRIKYLSGATMLLSDEARRKIQVFTEPDVYQLSLQTDYAFYSSSFIAAVDTSGFGYDLSFNALKNRFGQNAGISGDVGLLIRIGRHLLLSASALDIGGRIQWKQNTAYFHSLGKFEYSGLFLPGTDILNGTVDSLDFGAALDSLNDVLNFQRADAKLTTVLPARYYAAVHWQLLQRWTLGAVLHHQRDERRQTTAVGFSGYWLPLPWLGVGVMYSINNRSATNLGLSAAVRLGPVQAFALSDNALNAITPYRSAAVNFRIGGALVF